MSLTADLTCPVDEKGQTSSRANALVSSSHSEIITKHSCLCSGELVFAAVFH